MWIFSQRSACVSIQHVFRQGIWVMRGHCWLDASKTGCLRAPFRFARVWGVLVLASCSAQCCIFCCLHSSSCQVLFVLFLFCCHFVFFILFSCSSVFSSASSLSSGIPSPSSSHHFLHFSSFVSTSPFDCCSSSSSYVVLLLVVLLPGWFFSSLLWLSISWFFSLFLSLVFCLFFSLLFMLLLNLIILTILGYGFCCETIENKKHNKKRNI